MHYTWNIWFVCCAAGCVVENCANDSVILGRFFQRQLAAQNSTCNTLRAFFFVWKILMQKGANV